MLLTSEAHALALGSARERLVYVWSGAAAREPRQYLERDQYTHSHAQNAVLAVRAQAGGLEAFESGAV